MNLGKKAEESLLEEEDKKLLDSLKSAILNYEADEAKNAIPSIIERQIDPIFVLSHVVADAARIMGERFESGEIFLPHLVLAGDIMSEVSTMLEASMTSGESEKLAAKTIVIGTVEGDIHSIGKNIVAMLMKANGFKVHDLGVDVKGDLFIKEAEANKADAIAMSSLLTTTMPYQREVVEELKRMGVRDKYKVMVGGGPVTQEWTDRIGADGFGKDAIAAVKIAKELMNKD